MSFKLDISKRDRAAGRFKSRVHRALMKAVIAAKNEKGMTQTQIAELMDVEKSSVSRILNGRGNLTLKTIGDISWVLGLRPDITFSEVNAGLMEHANHPPHEHMIAVEAIKSSKTSSGSNVWVMSKTQKPAASSNRSVPVTATVQSKVDISYAN